MKTTAFYLESFNKQDLLVETEDRDLALETLSQFTGKDFHWLLCRIGKGVIVQNSTVKDTYFKKFWDLEKILLKDVTLLDVYKPCECCGK